MGATLLFRFDPQGANILIVFISSSMFNQQIVNAHVFAEKYSR